MPPIVPAIGAAAGAAAAAALGGTIGAVVIGTLISISLSVLASKLLPKPKQPRFEGLSQSQELTRTVRQAAAPARVVYGEQRVGGVYTYLESTNSNEFHHLVVYLCEGEIDAITTVYLDDRPIFAIDVDDAGYVISGQFAGNVRIKKHLGTSAQEADLDLVAEVGDITNTFRGRNRAYIYVRLQDDRNLFPRIIPDNITAVVRGRKVYNPDKGFSHWSNNPAWCLRDYLINTRFGVSVDEAKIEEAFFSEAAQICDQFVTPLTDTLTVHAFDSSNDTIRIDLDVLPLQTGDRIQLTTTGTLPDGLEASIDYYVQVVAEAKSYHEDGTVDRYAMIRVADSYDLARNTFVPPDIVDPDSDVEDPQTWRSFTTAGTGVATITKVGEPRYTCNGAFSTDQRVVDVIRDLRSSMGGRAVKAGGLWRAYAAAWREAVVDLTDDDIRSIQVQTRHSLRERFSAVRGTYRSPLLFGQLSDYPAVTNSTYDAADGGERTFADLPLPFTSRSNTAQRLANVELRRHRQEITVELTTTLKALQVQAGNNVTLTIDRYGWVAKEFEVDEYALQIEPDENDNPVILIKLVLRETAQANFDFVAANEELKVDPAPNTNLATIFDVTPPSDVQFESGDAGLTRQADGTILSGLLISWTNTATDRLNSSYEIQYKLATASDYRVVLVPASVTEHLITPLEEGAIYDVRIRGINVAGTVSEFITAQIEILGKTAPPPDVDIFTVAREADGTRRFAWVLKNEPLDLAGFIIRYRVGTSMGDFDTATRLHEGLLTASPYETNELAAGTYTFGIVAVDTSGNRSNNPAIISATLGDPRLRQALFSQIESAAGWPGTKTNCFVNPENFLEAVGATGSTWADFSGTAWEDVAGQNWLDAIPRVTQFVYESAVIDLGADLFTTPSVNATVQGTATVKMRTHTSAEGSDLTGETYIALAQISGERYVQFEITVDGIGSPQTDPPLLYEATLILDGERAIKDYEDINTATESGAFFNSIATGHFEINVGASGIAVISQASITAIQNVGAGFSWELISKSKTVDSKPAAEFKIYNSSSTLTDATVDIQLKGPKGTS